MVELFLLFLIVSTAKNSNNKKIKDQPYFTQHAKALPLIIDAKWNALNKTVPLIAPICRGFFIALEAKINEYNKISKTLPFFPFEGLRHPIRQHRLVKAGRSWIKDILKAPHVEGRAVDFVQFDNKSKKWIWNQKEALKMREWINENFKESKRLRDQIRVNNNSVDSYHFEHKRIIGKG